MRAVSQAGATGEPAREASRRLVAAPRLLSLSRVPEHPRPMSKLLPLLLSPLLSLACSSTITGTGEPDPARTGTDRTAGEDTDDDATARAEIAELFSPTSPSPPTPDMIFGLWAAEPSWFPDVDLRLRVDEASVLLAARCKSDDAVAFIKVPVLAKETRITLRETKRAGFDAKSSCRRTLELSAGVWDRCEFSYSSGCFSVNDMVMDLRSIDHLPSRWSKLAD